MPHTHRTHDPGDMTKRRAPPTRLLFPPAQPGVIPKIAHHRTFFGRNLRLARITYCELCAQINLPLSVGGRPPFLRSPHIVRPPPLFSLSHTPTGQLFFRRGSRWNLYHSIEPPLYPHHPKVGSSSHYARMFFVFSAEGTADNSPGRSPG